MAFCSAVTLCFASIFSLVSAALLAIAFSTDNWQQINVNRAALEKAAQDTNNQEILNKFNTSPLYFTRTRGLFRECFPGEKDKNAPQIPLYLSPVETYCHNINYYIPDDARETQDFSKENMTRIHMGRSTIALFIACFVMMFIAFITGVIGCWKTGHSHILASAALMLIACLMSAGAMGLWHGVEYFEKEKINEKSDVELFVKSWDPLLQDPDLVSFRYAWSYIVAWVGVGMCLASASLFAMAGFCIKNDREHEEAMNMQYLMPVYPQKGQPYGPYGYAAYPGPAAYYGSQYGLPYSQY